MKFKLKSDFSPKGDQPHAIDQLVDGIKKNMKHQTLLGVTGSGKTFTMANVIEKIQMPTLVISHNKTLAAQLYQEFKEFFPENAVEYFVSFYDYYQPEAYLPASDLYIEKSSDINDEIDKLRLKATSSLMSRRDVIIVASVSCIYNIGSPLTYAESSMAIATGDEIDRDDFFQKLVIMQYTRNDMSFIRGTYRVRGDTIDIYPAYEDTALRIETFGDRIESINKIHIVSGKIISPLDKITLFPAKHFVTTDISMQDITDQIRKELDAQLDKFEAEGKTVEAYRLKQRTLYDIEMLNETGYTNGIENYSRIFDGRAPGSRPYSLLDFFETPFLTIIDESHATIPQVGGMYNGDKSRKTTLVDYGFRIPSALDNRPLQFNEFENLSDFNIYSSATPADYELEKSDGIIAEQIIRPTGLVDPVIEVRPAKNQVDDLIEELRSIVERKERALVTTLTKKMSEDLTEYLESLDFKVRYLHSEIDTLKRPEILKNLREGIFDILIGINLLREGLDLPEVSLVVILDADREGFLRSTRSLIQIAGRAARNIRGKIILYADTITKSIKKTLDESDRRRKKQLEHNKKYKITPESVVREIRESISLYEKEEKHDRLTTAEPKPSYIDEIIKDIFFEDKDREKGITDQIRELEREMVQAAENLEFEKAARLRDKIVSFKKNINK